MDKSRSDVYMWSVELSKWIDMTRGVLKNIMFVATGMDSEVYALAEPIADNGYTIYRHSNTGWYPFPGNNAQFITVGRKNTLYVTHFSDLIFKLHPKCNIKL